MAEQEFRDIFNDCIDRMAAGQSIQDCLRLYPQHAAMLRPMLEAGRLVSQAQADSADVALAQARVREQVRQRAFAPRPRKRSYGRALALVASLLIALTAIFAGAENSLPGDSLYGVKRLGEGARGVLLGQDFATRRLDEIRVLLALRREADVQFRGVVEAINGGSWRIAGLDTVVPAGIPGSDSTLIGDLVEVDAHTTSQGDLVASSIRVLGVPTPPPATDERLVATLAPTETREPVQTATPTYSQTPLDSATPEPTTTSSNTPTSTATSTETSTPTWTATHTPTATLTATPSATPTLTPSRTALPPTATLPLSPTACVPTMPAGWVRYVIQVGDTVAGLAIATGVTVEQVIAVNCLPQTQMIIAGQPLFLPKQPNVSGSATQQPTSQTSIQPTDDHGGGSGNGGDKSGSGSGDSGGDDHGGHGSDG